MSTRIMTVTVDLQNLIKLNNLKYQQYAYYLTTLSNRKMTANTRQLAMYWLIIRTFFLICNNKREVKILV